MDLIYSFTVRWYVALGKGFSFSESSSFIYNTGVGE